MDPVLFIVVMSTIFIILFVIFVFVVPKRGIGLTLADVNSCLARCDDLFNDCNSGCSNGNPDESGQCSLSCQLNVWSCNADCYPSIFAIRNGSVYDMNFFAANGNLLGSLDGWSPNKLVVNKSDFPILACYCNPVGTCDCATDSNYGYVFPDPGCYILWYFQGFYSTSDICSTAE